MTSQPRPQDEGPTANKAAVTYIPLATMLAVLGLWVKTINAAVAMEGRTVRIENRQNELIRSTERMESKLDQALDWSRDLDRRITLLEAKAQD